MIVRRALVLSLYAAALCLPISVAAGNIALALLTIALVARLLLGPRERPLAFGAWRAEPALAALTAYVVAGVLAGALGDGARHSFCDSLKDAHRIWVLWLFVAAFALEPAARPWAAFAAGIALVSTAGVGESAFGWLRANTLARAHGFIHPVTFGEVTALAALGGLSYLSRPPSGGVRERRIALAATALCAAALALSQTRAALLSLGVGAAVAAWLEPRARRWAAAGVGLAALGAACGEWLRYGRAGFGTAVGAYNPSAPQQVRRVLWDAAWRMFRDHPWTGVGPGHYKTEFPRYFSGFLDGQADWASAHNLYLHQLAERGLVGEAALLALFGVLLARAWRAERARRDAASLWTAAAVPAFLVMNVTEIAWQNEQLAALFLLVWAFGTASRAGEIV